MRRSSFLRLFMLRLVGPFLSMTDIWGTLCSSRSMLPIILKSFTAACTAAAFLALQAAVGRGGRASTLGARLSTVGLALTTACSSCTSCAS